MVEQILPLSVVVELAVRVGDRVHDAGKSIVEKITGKNLLGSKL